MTNYGNTGQRYKMSKFAKVEQVDEKNLHVTLACGHGYSYPNDWRGTLPLFEKFIAQGKRTRCDECRVQEAQDGHL